MSAEGLTLNEPFDLYIYARCRRGTDEDALLALLPAEADSSVLDLLLEDCRGHDAPLRDCFMGLELPVGKAYVLREQLAALGATSIILPSRYRVPRLTVDQAFAIARQDIEQRITQDKKLSRSAFSPVEPIPRFEHPTCWTFGAPSPQLQDEGFIPGVIFSAIDKCDGHVHQPREELELVEEWLELGRSAHLVGTPELPRELRQRRKRRESHR